MLSRTPNGPEDHGGQLKWMITVFFPWSSLTLFTNIVEVVPMPLGCIAANKTELLVFIDDVTAY